MKKMYLTTAFLSVMLLTGCQSEKHQTTGEQAVRVKVIQVSTSSREAGGHFSGTVEEENGTALSFAITGTVEKVYFHLGQRVTKGQLLASLNPVSMQSSYDAAKASLEQAEDAYRRMKELHDKGSLPEIQWVEVQSRLRQARSMEEIASKNLKDCNLYAPFGGVIAEKSVETGQNVMPGMGVAKLVTAGMLKVKIAVPETEIAAITTGEKAEITVPALGGQRFTGTVVEKGAVANSLSRSYDVKLRVADAPAELMPGMVTEVRIEKEETSEQLVIPAAVVQLDEKNRSFVWTEQGGTASKRVIACGEFTAQGVTVLSGLESEDRIIIEGQQKVCEGTKIIF